MNGKEAMSFLHDSNSRHDPKMLKLWTKFNYEGIGIFWCIVEILREQPDFKYSMDDICLIAIELRCDKVLVNDLIRYCLQPEVSIFIEQDGYFFSESLLRRMEKFKESHFRMSEGGKLGMKRRYSKGVSKVDISTLQGGYKVVGKVKEKKRKQSSSFLKPTIEDVRAYIQEIGSTINPETFLSKNEANGWVIGKNRTPMKDWKATIRYWQSLEKKTTNERIRPNTEEAPPLSREELIAHKKALLEQYKGRTEPRLVNAAKAIERDIAELQAKGER